MSSKEINLDSPSCDFLDQQARSGITRELHFLYHSESPSILVQLLIKKCGRFREVIGIKARRDLDSEGSKRWQTVEKEIEATVFESYQEAVEARHLYRVPVWFRPKPLMDHQAKIAFLHSTDQKQAGLGI